MHIHIQAYTPLKKNSDCLIYCILSNGEVIKYHKFISVVVIELSVRCLNTGPEDRLKRMAVKTKENINYGMHLSYVHPLTTATKNKKRTQQLGPFLR